MLPHPTFEKLQTLRLTGMCKALEDQLQMPDHETLSFDERFGLLVDRELTERDNRRLQTRLRTAKLRQPASLDSKPEHDLSKKTLPYTNTNLPILSANSTAQPKLNSERQSLPFSGGED